MTSLRDRRLTKLSAGAALLVLAGLFVPPTAAASGCSHLVTSRTDPLVNLVHLDDLIVGRLAPSVHGHRAQLPLEAPDAPRRAPCSGWSCSNSVPMPASSITPVPDARERWGALGVVFAVDNRQVYGLRTEGPAPAPTGHKSSIFHPPRV
jgi:hypothetical protein